MFSPDHSNPFPPPLKLRNTFRAGTPMWRRKLLQSSLPGSNNINRVGVFFFLHPSESETTQLITWVGLDGRFSRWILSINSSPFWNKKNRNIFRFSVGHRPTGPWRAEIGGSAQITTKSSPSVHPKSSHISGGFSPNRSSPWSKSNAETTALAPTWIQNHHAGKGGTSWIAWKYEKIWRKSLSMKCANLLMYSYIYICLYDLFMAIQPTPRTPPPRNKGLIAGLIKGNRWLISP